MNAPILKLFGVVLVLFAGLVGFSSWNSVIGAEDLRANAKNKRDVIEELRVKRGTLRAADGTVLARSVPGPDDTFRRRYPDAARDAAHVVGYSDVDLGRAGVEQTYNEELMGEGDEITSLFEDLRGKLQEGDDVRLNLDLGAQRKAIEALGGRKGAVVAIEPQTGRVRAMVSVPSYDPETLKDPKVFRDLSTDAENSPLLNRATQAGYPPGSTFKVVTAATALDSGRFTKDSVVDGSSPKTISGAPLNNFGNWDFGPVTLTTALTNSVNTVWAQVAVRLGDRRMREYMERFGFYAKPKLDYPRDQMLASGVYVDGELLRPTNDAVDIGRVAIGQERLRVTPLQMATVAATVANGGMRMKAHIANRIVDEDGRTVERVEPEEAERVMSQDSAAQLTQMMTNVVKEGTGTAAALEGVDVAGKTGTAELNIPQRLNQPWFIGFAPRSSPTVAIAVTLENVIGGQGGVDAAPIARQVMESLLR